MGRIVVEVREYLYSYIVPQFYECRDDCIYTIDRGPPMALLEMSKRLHDNLVRSATG